jgi:hypothetical protein
MTECGSKGLSPRGPLAFPVILSKAAGFRLQSRILSTDYSLPFVLDFTLTLLAPSTLTLTHPDRLTASRIFTVPTYDPPSTHDSSQIFIPQPVYALSTSIHTTPKPCSHPLAWA